MKETERSILSRKDMLAMISESSKFYNLSR